jgi:hypothetical protein
MLRFPLFVRVFPDRVRGVYPIQLLLWRFISAPTRAFGAEGRRRDGYGRSLASFFVITSFSNDERTIVQIIDPVFYRFVAFRDQHVFFDA